MKNIREAAVQRSSWLVHSKQKQLNLGQILKEKGKPS
jgi:hypothetical protein